jgi:hypothetical protein
MKNHFAATTLLAASAAPVLAIGCDELRDSIDARIRAGGVSSFSLTVVAADTTAPGAVVGTCDRGARKIHYLKGTASAAPVATLAPAPATAAKPVAAASTAPAPAPAAKPKAAAPEVITECDDGTSVTHGACKP